MGLTAELMQFHATLLLCTGVTITSPKIFVCVMVTVVPNLIFVVVVFFSSSSNC